MSRYNSMKKETILKSTSKNTSPQTQGNSGWSGSGFLSSLRFKATAIAVVISVVPVVVIGAMSYWIADRRLNNEVQNKQKVTAEILAERTSGFVFERYGDIVALSQQPILVNKELREGTTVLQKKELLDRYLSYYGKIYDSIAFIDREGNNIAVTGDAEHINHKDDRYFQEAIKGSAFISQPQSFKQLREKVVYIAAPIKDSFSNEVIGVVRTRISLAGIKELFSDVEKLGHIHLVDKRGHIFLSLINEDEKDEQKDQEPEDGESSARTTKADEIFPMLAEESSKGKSGAFTTVDEIDGEQELIGFSAIPNPIANLSNLEWSVLVETELEEAFAAQQELGNTFIVGTLITTILVMAIVAYIANESVKPILEASTTVKKIGQGDLGFRLPVKGSDELSTLAANTNSMADKIQQLLGKLQQNSENLSLRNKVVSKLLDLVRNEVLIEGNAKEAAKAFTKTIAATLSVDVASIWLYDKSHTTLTCLDRYNRKSQQHSEEQILKAEDLPKYFEALELGEIIAIDNTEKNPIVSELPELEKIPPQIASMLNVPVRNASGQTQGFVRCENQETPRQWTTEEQTFMNSVASLLSLSIESEFIQNEVAHLLDVVSHLEEGDLTVKAEVSDRITGLVADTLNRLTEGMAWVLVQILNTAQEVRENSRVQKKLASKLAGSAELQVKGVMQVLDLGQKVEKIATESAEQIQTTNQSLSNLETAVDRGHNLLGELTQGIGTLQQSNDRIVQQMKTLGEFVGLADQFVQEQSHIASLTQVLAMNASLVAARAAEQRDPRQFAVVAREFESIANQVSNLAHQTNDGLTILEQRSSQIHKVVSAVDSDVQNLGELMKEFTKGIEKSSQVFDTVQSVNREAVQSERVVVKSSEEIVAAAQCTAEVMEDIANLAAKIAKLTVNSQSRSETVDSLSDQMLKTIDFFSLPELPLQELLEPDSIEYTENNNTETSVSEPDTSISQN